MYRIEYIYGARPAGVDEDDLPWLPVPGASRPATLRQALEACLELEQDGDGRYTFRAVEERGPGLASVSGARLVRAAREVA